MLKYRQIAAQIEQSIRERDLAQGTKLPTFAELIQQYNVSKSTIVKALNILENRGIIYQIQGSGVFVRRKTRFSYVNMIENKGFTYDLDKFNITSKVLILEKVLPDLTVREHLNCQENNFVYHVKRMRYINGQILCIEDSFFNCQFIPYLNEEIIIESIFNYLKTALKLTVGFSDKYLHVIKLNDEMSQLLELSPNDPALSTEEIFYLSSGQAFDYSRTIYHYEHSQFFLQSNSLDNF